MKRLTDILQTQKLTDEQITAIREAMGEKKLFISGEENIDLRYNKLQSDHEASKSELAEAQKLIAELEKSQKDSESVQAKIAEYKEQVETLKAENEQIRIDAALHTALRDGGAQPDSVEYLIFKLKEAGEVSLTDDGKIAGIDDAIKDFKTKYAQQFVADGEGDAQGKVYDPKKLKTGEADTGISKEAFDKMGYADRLKLKTDDPETYAELSGKKTE